MQGVYLIVAGSIAALLLGMVALTVVLSLFRQRRAWKKQQLTDDTHPYKPGSLVVPPSYEAKEVIPPTVKHVLRRSISNDKTEPIPEHQRLKPQEGTPDQVVIQIDPLDGPTRDQRNVQKLIAYLKEEADRSNSTRAS
jgi:hypothetical protein